MISYLTGRLLRCEDTFLILLVNGVGYQVWCSKTTRTHATLNPENLSLEILSVYKQDSVTLFGFCSLHERDVFELLLNVQGVGGKMALSLLSALSSDALVHAIQLQDATALTQAEGVGPKLAQRITREIKDKVKKLARTFSEDVFSLSSSNQEDARLALTQLGYKPHEINEALKEILEDESKKDLNTDQLITFSLQKLSKRR